MKRAICKLRSLSAYSQSKKTDSPRAERESAKDHETRVWRERCHVTDEGFIFIPPMAFANSLKEAAKYLSIQVSG